jgi:hypothetical protein
MMLLIDDGTVWREYFGQLLVAQRNYGIDPGGAPRGKADRAMSAEREGTLTAIYAANDFLPRVRSLCI